jgi:hypothetical protein
VLRSIVPKLEQSGIPYLITGSIAAAYYGRNRTTYDLDIIISVTADKLKNLIELLPKDQYYAVLQDALDAYRHHSMFNVLDTTSGWKIDFILKKPAPFHGEAFQRRRAVTFDGVPTSVISAEDLILSSWTGQRCGNPSARCGTPLWFWKSSGNNSILPTSKNGSPNSASLTDGLRPAAWLTSNKHAFEMGSLS